MTSSCSFVHYYNAVAVHELLNAVILHMNNYCMLSALIAIILESEGFSYLILPCLQI